MRERHDYLHDATKATFEGNVKAIADGWGKTERYIHYILTEDRPDYFPAFYSQYIGVLKGGVSTCHYDNELEYARQRYGKRKTVHNETECFIEKQNSNSRIINQYIEFAADGHWSLDEIKSVEESLDREENAIQMIRTMLNFKKELLENGSFVRGKSMQPFVS